MTERKIYAISLESAEAVQAALGGRSGGGDGGMEARLARVEASVGHIQTDISEIKGDLRKILGALLAAFLILGGMMLTGYLRMSDQISQIQTELASKH